ncbi:MAG: M6 family metalloprotease domain-containing protein, partial [Candidatus Goldbacteria bacterium]|nr:M6 family metalloprotease domain-containing protein [Candidatus Goldiibacteriota bacterium]
TIPRSEIENYLNQIGYTGFGNKGSIRDYFRDISSNKLDYINIVTDYYMAPKPRSYYITPQDLFVARSIELITGALDYLVASGFDFSQLSVENNEYVALNAFYVGGMDIVAHYCTLSSLYYIPGTSNFFYHYQITNIDYSPKIGIFAHENGHLLLNWPDLYDNDSGGVGNADLMSTGCWNNDAKDPADTNPFYRHAAGWTNVIDIDSNTRGVFYAPANVNFAYRFLNPDSPNESFYIENRRKSGRSYTMPGEGLTIWHIDWYGSNNNQQMTYESHYLVSLEQADGLFQLERNECCLDSNDFFYAGNKNSFTGNTIPNSRWWNGNYSGLNIKNISEISDNMSFELVSEQPMRHLNLQIKNSGQDSCVSNMYNVEIKITNYDNIPVSLSNLSVCFWFYSQDKININGCWGGQVNNASGNYFGTVNSNVSHSYLQSTCIYENNRMANQKIKVNFTGPDIPANGGYAQGMNLQLYRGSWLTPFDDGCNDFSKNTINSYTDYMYVALYENDVLLDEWISATTMDTNTGKEPCRIFTYTYTTTMTPTFTPTRVFTNTATVTRVFSPTITSTRTRTNTPVITRTFTVTRTPTRIISPAYSFTSTRTFTRTAIITPTITLTGIISLTTTPTRSRTNTPTMTGTIIYTRTPTRTISPSYSFTSTGTFTRTVIATRTFTPTPTITSGLVAIRVQYYSPNIAENTNTLYVNMRIINDSQTPLPLKDVTAKYWFTQEGTPGTDIVENDYSATSDGLYLNPYVTKTVNIINQAGQNRVMIIGFTPEAGNISPGGYAQLQLRIHKDNWTNYTQSTDYSFGTHTSYQNWTKITGYLSGVKVWGVEPGYETLAKLK